MIPARIVITSAPQPNGAVIFTYDVAGTQAEQAQHTIEGQAAMMQQLGDKAGAIICLQMCANSLASLEWTTAAENVGLPAHALRMVVELDDLNRNLDKLNSFIGEWPDNLNATFKALPMIDQTDLLEQQEAMAAHATVLNRRLERARAEVGQ